jgi:hypothetical protein
MTNVAYLLFTFTACMFGLGVGLLIHFLWGRLRNVEWQADPVSSIADGETTSWDSYSKWQAENNRRFATQVVCCAAIPLLLSGAAWSERTDVVKSVCGAFSPVMGQAYICNAG